MTVTGERRCSRRRAARSPARCRRPKFATLPLNGRNFLDLALLVPGVSPTNTGEQPALRRNLRRARAGHLGRQPAQFLQQLHRRRPVGQRRCRRAERHLLRPRRGEQFQVVTSGGQAELGRALGGYINVVTKSGTNALHGDLYGYFRNQRFNAANALSQHEAADDAGAVRREPRRPDRSATARSTSPTSSSAQLESDRARSRSRRRTSAAINARLAAVGLSGPADRDRPLSESGAQHQLPRQDRPPVQRTAISSASATASTTCTAATRAAPAALNAATASAGLDNTRSDRRRRATSRRSRRGR